MMKKEVLLFVLMGSLLVSCHSDLKFDNIDPKAQLDMGVALKIATVTATLGDFVDQSEDLFIYKDSTAKGEPKMVVAWRHTYPDSRDYHPIDPNMFNRSTSFRLNVPAGEVSGKVVMTVPMDLELANSDVTYERVDSAHFNVAHLISRITTSNMPADWKWNWVNSIVLEIGPQGRYASGNEVTIYDGESEGTVVTSDLNHLSLCLMNDRSLTPADYDLYPDNARKNWVLNARITFTIPSGQKVTFSNDAAFVYDLSVDLSDYEALWGYFKPSKKMTADEIIDMDDYLHDYPFAKRAKLPITDPKVEVEVSTFIAGLMKITSDHAYAKYADGSTLPATFDGETHAPDHYMTPEEMLDIDESTIGDSAVTHVLFNNTVARGKLDDLFKTVPTFLYYQFKVQFDTTQTPQIRLTPNTLVSINTTCTAPLMFDRNLFIDYIDTITDIDLKDVDIDSLANEVEWIDTLRASDITLYLTARNYIPLAMKGKVRFLDENDQPVKDPEDPTKDFYPFAEDSVRFAPPRYIKDGDEVIPDPNQPGKTIITVRMNKVQVNALKNIKKIEYHVYADNDALQYAYQMGLDKIRLEKDTRLLIDVGVTAHIDAVMNFENIK